MTRLDQLAQPNRRNGEHIRAVIERQRRQQIETNDAFEKSSSPSTRNKSRSLTHLAHRSGASAKLHHFGGSNASDSRTLRKSNTTKSMTQLVTSKLLNTSKSVTNHLPTVVKARYAKTKPNPIVIEIDSRTTNVSVAGVFVYFTTFFY